MPSQSSEAFCLKERRVRICHNTGCNAQIFDNNYYSIMVVYVNISKNFQVCVTKNKHKRKKN